jgi:hypothetical protein
MLTQHLVPRASTELSRSLNKYVIEFMNRGTKGCRDCELGIGRFGLYSLQSLGIFIDNFR